MDGAMKDQIANGRACLKKMKSIDKSAPVLRAEIEVAPSTAIDGNLKDEIKRGASLKTTETIDKSAPVLIAEIEEELNACLNVKIPTKKI